MGHTRTHQSHTPNAATAETQTPIPSGGGYRARAHTLARDATRTPSRRDVSRKGGERDAGSTPRWRRRTGYGSDVSSPTSVGTVPLKALALRSLRDREAREGEPSGTHSHTSHTHPKRGDGGGPTPIPSGGGIPSTRAHTCERRHTHAIAQRRETERGGEGCGQHAEMAEAHRVSIDVSSPTSVGTVPLKALLESCLRDREEREGEPSGTHTYTIHTPQTWRRRRPNPDPLGGGIPSARAHTCERRHTHAIAQKREPERGERDAGSTPRWRRRTA